MEMEMGVVVRGWLWRGKLQRSMAALLNPGVVLLLRLRLVVTIVFRLFCN